MKMLIISWVYQIIFLLAVTLCSGVVWAKKETISPDSVKGTVKINAEQLIELVGRMPEMVIVDSRIVADRQQGYIEGSVNLPNTETTCMSLSKYIPDLARPSLFYCNGVKCGRSAKALKIAVSCGFSNLYWFRGGFEEWKNKGYPIVGTH